MFEFVTRFIVVRSDLDGSNKTQLENFAKEEEARKFAQEKIKEVSNNEKITILEIALNSVMNIYGRRNLKTVDLDREGKIIETIVPEGAVDTEDYTEKWYFIEDLDNNLRQTTLCFDKAKKMVSDSEDALKVSYIIVKRRDDLNSILEEYDLNRESLNLVEVE